MNLRYILTRAATILLIIVLALYAFSFVKKVQRRSAIVSELKSLASESSFFRQFSRADAEKSLVRAVGLIAEARKNGLEPEAVINRALGIEEKYFAMDEDRKEVPRTEQLIRSTLRSNYENFRKLGYVADFHTLAEMSEGNLPPVRTGSMAGTKAVVGTIIDPMFSPGLGTVVANLEIRPVRESSQTKSDIEIAIAKRLATDLSDAGIIEESAEKRIIRKLLGEPEPEPEPEQE